MVDGQSVAPLLLQGIGSWSETLSTLGLAIMGGIAALSIQIFINNQNQENAPLRLRAIASMIVAFLLQGANILFGFLVHGSLVAGIPALLSAQYYPDKSIEQNQIVVLDVIQSFAYWQFILFGIGALALLPLIPFNWVTLRGKP